MSDQGATPPPPPPPPPPPTGGYGPGVPGAGGVPVRTNPKAIWALVLGIVGLLFGLCCGLITLVTGIAATILGRKAQGEIDASGGAQQGRGMATAGFVLGIISIVVSVVLIILAVVALSNGDYQFGTAP